MALFSWDLLICVLWLAYLSKLQESSSLTEPNPYHISFRILVLGVTYIGLKKLRPGITSVGSSSLKEPSESWFHSIVLKLSCSCWLFRHFVWSQPQAPCRNSCGWSSWALEPFSLVSTPHLQHHHLQTPLQNARNDTSDPQCPCCVPGTCL